MSAKGFGEKQMPRRERTIYYYCGKKQLGESAEKKTAGVGVVAEQPWRRGVQLEFPVRV